MKKLNQGELRQARNGAPMKRLPEHASLYTRVHRNLKLLVSKVLARVGFGRNVENKKYSPNERPNQAAIFQQFSKQFGTPKRVAYIGCLHDVSPIKGFPQSEVTFVDVDKEAMDLIEKHHREPRLTFLTVDARHFKPKDQQDVLIDVSSGATKKALSTLKVGGHLIHAYTYSPWTCRDKRLKLVAVVDSEDKTTMITDKKLLYGAGGYEEEADDYDARLNRTDRTAGSAQRGFGWGTGRKRPASWYIFEKVAE